MTCSVGDDSRSSLAGGRLQGHRQVALPGRQPGALHPPQAQHVPRRRHRQDEASHRYKCRLCQLDVEVMSRICRAYGVAVAAPPASGTEVDLLAAANGGVSQEAGWP